MLRHEIFKMLVHKIQNRKISIHKRVTNGRTTYTASVDFLEKMYPAWESRHLYLTAATPEELAINCRGHGLDLTPGTDISAGADVHVSGDTGSMLVPLSSEELARFVRTLRNEQQSPAADRAGNILVVWFLGLLATSGMAFGMSVKFDTDAKRCTIYLLSTLFLGIAATAFLSHVLYGHSHWAQRLRARIRSWP
jgi:hypothetical protein